MKKLTPEEQTREDASTARTGLLVVALLALAALVSLVLHACPPGVGP